MDIDSLYARSVPKHRGASCKAGAQIPLAKLSLIYAENGRGKTTLIALDSGWLRI
jgi:wobble nucleotide-excising tRNase